MPHESQAEATPSRFKHLSLGQVANLLGVHRTTLLREIDRGRLAASRIGNQWRISEQALARYLEHATEAGDDRSTT